METGYMIERPKASGETEEVELVPGKPQTFSLYYTHDEKPLRWSASFPMPQLGQQVMVTMNNLGLATVVGFFHEAGYAGLHVRFHNPPKWWTDQRKREQKDEATRWSKRPQWSKDGIGCVFGSEVTL